MFGVYRGCRIAANVVAAVAIVLLLVDPTRNLTPICLLLILVIALWFTPVIGRKITRPKR
jgi:hypothetical protein